MDDENQIGQEKVGQEKAEQEKAERSKRCVRLIYIEQQKKKNWRSLQFFIFDLVQNMIKKVFQRVYSHSKQVFPLIFSLKLSFRQMRFPQHLFDSQQLLK